jgi:hypothetical protein
VLALVLVSGLEIGIGLGLELGSGHALWETLGLGAGVDTDQLRVHRRLLHAGY